MSLSSVADEVKNQMVVWAKDGTSVVYVLDETPKVTFTDTDLVINTGGIEVHYALDQLEKFTYQVKEISSVDDLKNSNRPFSFNGESLVFPNMEKDEIISIFSANGTLVLKKQVDKNGTYAFSASKLKLGTYLVNVNGLTYKIVKK